MRSLPSPEKVGGVVLAGVDKAVDARWGAAQTRADRLTGSREHRIAQLRQTFLQEMVAAGGAVGAAAAAPGVGTVAVVGASLTELGWVTMRSADVILTVAAIHGHTDAEVEERRAWVLSVLAFGDTAAAGFTRLAGEMGKGLGKKATAAVPTELLRQINRALGRTIVTKYGTKRGVIALGRALPFGFGALIGGGGNYLLGRAIATNADRFFRELDWVVEPAQPLA